MLIPDGRMGYLACASEGGHGNLPIENEREVEFQQFALSRLQGVNYVSWEDVLSGRGVSLVHEFLTDQRLGPEQISAKLQATPETLHWLATFYGRMCRNFALEVFATGGVYITGSVAAKNPVLLSCESFRDAFLATRVHRQTFERIPVYLVDDDDNGLWGAAYFGVRTLIDRLD